VLGLVMLRDAWPPLDTLSPLAGHALALSVVAIAALVARRLAGIVLVAGIAMTGIINAAPALINPDGHLASIGAMRRLVATGPEGGTGLRVLQLNAWNSNRDIAKLMRYLESSDADIVVLSEFGPSKQELIGRLSRSYPFIAGCVEYRPCSQLLLSRRPFAASGARAPDARHPPLVWARFEGAIGAPDVTVLGTHIYRPSRSHLLHRRQLEGLAGFLAGIDGEVIVVGDFNMTTWSLSYAAFLAQSGLVAARLNLPTWPAWPLTLPQFQIDHMFVSSGLAIRSQRVGPYVGSDHLPLLSVVRVPEHLPVLAERRKQDATGQRSGMTQ